MKIKLSHMCDLLFSSMSYAELFLCISRIVRQFDLELYNTTMEDLDMTHARIVGYPKNVTGKKFLGEIRVKVQKKNLARQEINHSE